MALLNRIHSPRQDRRFLAEVQDEVDEVISERVDYTSKYERPEVASHADEWTPNRVQMRSHEESATSSPEPKRIKQ